jgi:predicted ATP-dependent endonuclease of OLD family
MAIDYRFSRIDISGFRGIRDLRLGLPERDPTYLIGANNAGKSTVINACALALKGGGFHTFTPDIYDYFAEPTGERVATFRIDLHMTRLDVLPAVQGVGNPVDVHGIRVLGKTDKAGKNSHQHTLFDANGETITMCRLPGGCSGPGD